MKKTDTFICPECKKELPVEEWHECKKHLYLCTLPFGALLELERVA